MDNKTSYPCLPLMKPEENLKSKDEMNVSFYGASYPKDSEWFHFKPFEKPVNIKELPLFQREYKLCCEKNIYRPLARTVNTGDGRHVSIEFTKGDKRRWEECFINRGYYYKIEDMVDAHTAISDDGNVTLSEIRVCKKAFDDYFDECSFFHKKIPSQFLVRVRSSEKYGNVASVLVGNYYNGEIYFEKCKNCRDVFCCDNLEEFKSEEFDYDGALFCEKCRKNMEAREVIKKHNYKKYPKPNQFVTKRLGHRIIDGLVWATMEHVDVPKIRYYGVEVETELHLESAARAKVDRFKMAKNVLDAMGRDFVIVKEDGSLITNGKYSDGDGPGKRYAGFEIVSAPAPIEIHREKWPKIVETANYEVLRSWDYDTCGFHIHVSREGLLDDLVIGRILVFVNSENNRKFIWKVAGRSEVNFTKYMQRRFSDCIKPELVINPDEKNQHDMSRRVAINLANDNTVEIRIFRGTINPKHIIRNLEFFDSLIDFCMPCERSMADMHDFRKYVSFVDCNRKRWPLLASWFAFHEITKLKKILRPEKVNYEKLTINTKDIPEKEILV